MHIYERSIDCAIRHIEVARDNFEYLYSDDHNVSEAMGKYEQALNILRGLKEYIPPELEVTSI